MTPTFLASTQLEPRLPISDMRGRKKQPVSLPPPENNQEQADTNDDELLPTAMTTTKKSKKGASQAKRDRPADVDTSKSVSSPKRKKKKAGVLGVIRQPLTGTDDDDDPVPTVVRRPQPRLRRAPGTTSTAAKAQSTRDDVASKLTSVPEDTEDEKRQRLAAALVDADTREAKADQQSKARNELARRMLADQNPDDAMDSSEEEDTGSDNAEDAEDMPMPKRGANKVHERHFVQCESLLTCIVTPTHRARSSPRRL